MTEPKDGRERITPTRIAIWILVGGVGVYMVVSGLITTLSGGS